MSLASPITATYFSNSTRVASGLSFRFVSFLHHESLTCNGKIFPKLRGDSEFVIIKWCAITVIALKSLVEHWIQVPRRRKILPRVSGVADTKERIETREYKYLQVSGRRSCYARVISSAARDQYGGVYCSC